MIPIGPVEKKIYALREKHPLVIPQIDPDNYTIESVLDSFRQIKQMEISHIAIGGTILNMKLFQKIIDVAIEDFNFSVVTYITNPAVSLVEGYSGKTAVYWITALNSENPFFFKDSLIMSSLAVSMNKFEPIPTAYIFDERDSVGTANWLARAVPIPREKPYISLSVALAAQFSGLRFYVMAGGSGSKLPPPTEHIKLLSKKTNLFLIPTSGIRTVAQVEECYEAGADAIHVGNLIEEKGGLEVLGRMVKASKKYSGKKFYDDEFGYK